MARAATLSTYVRRLPAAAYSDSCMYAMPWPLEKLAERSPVMLIPAVTAAAACSPSGSKKRSRRPLTLVFPLAMASAQPSPIWVEGVMG
jgi:hypothetical protein